MFIKKDLRKIEEILVDANDNRDRLLLSKRGSEFQGNIRVICRESTLSALTNLKVLNLYDNSLVSLQGKDIPSYSVSSGQI
jgi:hypothetical protein